MQSARSPTRSDTANEAVARRGRECEHTNRDHRDIMRGGTAHSVLVDDLRVLPPPKRRAARRAREADLGRPTNHMSERSSSAGDDTGDRRDGERDGNEAKDERERRKQNRVRGASCLHPFGCSHPSTTTEPREGGQ